LAICIKLPQAGIDVGIDKAEADDDEEDEREESIIPLVKYPKI
jgi:hypothetical protein